MKKFLIKLGNIIAILMIFSPIIIIRNYKYFNDYRFYILLLCSIAYSTYIYFILSKENEFKNDKEHYYTYIKNSDKKLNLNLSYEEKYKLLEEYIENHFDKCIKK